VLDDPTQKLKTAPGFDKNHWPTTADRKWGSEIHTFYGATPSWVTRTVPTSSR
jgi:hypothetical protein